MKTIVALVDFADVPAKILAHAQQLAGAFRSKVILMHVVPPEPMVASYGAELPVIPMPSAPEIIRADKARLDALLASLREQGVNATAVQFNGPIAETALTEIPKLEADLVIMGSHHHGAIYNFFIGNITTEVIKAAAFPVLVVPLETEESPVS